MKSGAEEAVEYTFSQGVPLIDFGAGAVGPPPLPFERPIGFDVSKPAIDAGQVPQLPPALNPEKTEPLPSLDVPAAPTAPSNHSPPPKYETVVTNYHPVPRPRTTGGTTDDLPGLPDVPLGTPQHVPKPANSADDAIDFDDLAKRFEALKKKK